MANFLKAHWDHIIMANYAVPEHILHKYLPHGTELDLFSGKAYVSLVGFMFRDTKLFRIPIPLLGTFEEVNLRFYVTRKEENVIKRGVVFVNETIPYKAVAWVANKLYKEHYTAIPTKHRITENAHSAKKEIEYQWQVDETWNKIQVTASIHTLPLPQGSAEEFIFEHYYGYTRISADKTEEYTIDHPRWNIYPVESYAIQCDFEKAYGKEFSFLNRLDPDSVFLAEGSAVAVKWKRRKIQLNAV